MTCMSATPSPAYIGTHGIAMSVFKGDNSTFCVSCGTLLVIKQHDSYVSCHLCGARRELSGTYHIVKWFMSSLSGRRSHHHDNCACFSLSDMFIRFHHQTHHYHPLIITNITAGNTILAMRPSPCPITIININSLFPM